MGQQQFALLVDRVPTGEQLTALFKTCGDVVIEYDAARGCSEVFFDRDAPTLCDAVVSGVRDLDAIGLPPVRVLDDDDLVTLGMIAARIGRSLHAVRLWAAGRTGPGGFPPPVSANLDDPLHRWNEVAHWLRDRMAIEVRAEEPVFAAVNLALQLRAMAPHVERMAAVRDLVPG